MNPSNTNAVTQQVSHPGTHHERYQADNSFLVDFAEQLKPTTVTFSATSVDLRPTKTDSTAGPTAQPTTSGSSDVTSIGDSSLRQTPRLIPGARLARTTGNIRFRASDMYEPEMPAGLAEQIADHGRSLSAADRDAWFDRLRPRIQWRDTINDMKD